MSMRVLVFLLIVAILIVIAGVATGFLNISQVRTGRAPEITATRNGVTAKGGQPPAFDVETGSVKVGTKAQTVAVPTLVVEKPAGTRNEAATNNTM